MTTRAEVEKAVESAPTSYERILVLGALLSEAAGEPAVVVGGSAIEVYTSGGYVSSDIDVVVNRSKAASAIESWGFTRTGRFWWRGDWRIGIDLVGDDYKGSRRRIQTVDTPYGPAWLAGIEDLLMKRLAELKYWQNPPDRQRALAVQAEMLLAEGRDRLDEEYLAFLARRDGVVDVLADLRQRVRTAPPGLGHR